MTDRIASVERNTLETQIQVKLNLDGTGVGSLKQASRFLSICSIKSHGTD